MIFQSTTRINLKQLGTKLSGEARIEYKDDAATKTYNVSGEIRGSFILMYLTSKNTAGAYQTFILQHHDDDLMKGIMSFFGKEESRFRAIDCELKRCK